MTVHELLNRRFATKAFDTTKKVSEEDLNYILEACRLSASSYNTQPWKIIVVTNPELRTAIRLSAYNQAQVTDASHLLVVTALRSPVVRIDKTAELIAAAAGEEKATGFKGYVMADVNNRPAEALLSWMQKQTYIALGSMMLAAAERGLDSCPMEGFDAAKVTDLLGLTDAVATTMLPIGYAATANTGKIRVAVEEIVEQRN